MSLLGTGWNANTPTQDDFTKNAPGILRDLKTRLKTFWAVNFDPDTGLLKPSVVANTKLKDVAPSPVGEKYQEVDVSDRGLVLAGRTDSVSASSGKIEWNSYFASDAYDFNNVLIDPLDPVPSPFWGAGSMTYQFTVPDGVQVIFVRAQGGGQGGGKGIGATGGQAGSYAEGTLDVTPGDIFQVWVGLGGAGGATTSPNIAGGPSLFFIAPNVNPLLYSVWGVIAGGGGLASGLDTAYVGNDGGTDPWIAGLASNGALGDTIFGGKAGGGYPSTLLTSGSSTRAGGGPKGCGGMPTGASATAGGDGASGFVIISWLQT